MPDAPFAAATSIRPARPGTQFVVVNPGALGLAFTGVTLHETMDGADVRLLLALDSPLGPALAAALDRLDLPNECLLAPGVPAPSGVAVSVMPPGSTAEEFRDMALAFADVVLAGPEANDDPLVLGARRLGRAVVAPGDALPRRDPAGHSVAVRLDPELPGWQRYGRVVFGRVEQALLEILAWNHAGREAGGWRKSRDRLRRCFRRGWGLTVSWPREWPAHPHGAAALARTSPLAACYGTLDRGATYGASLHRDLIWMTHLFGALAVFAAVAGSLVHTLGAVAWAAVEMMLLLAIAGMVLMARKTGLQERWTACRVGAEQVRVALMCLPLHVMPRFLVDAKPSPAPWRPPNGDALPPTAPMPRARHGAPRVPPHIAARRRGAVRRAVRDEGLPRPLAPWTPAVAAGWVKAMVDDQAGYHAANHRKLESFEAGLRVASAAFFGVAMVAVLLHLVEATDWLLLLLALLATLSLAAGLPAFLASFTLAILGVLLHVTLTDTRWLLLATAAGPAAAAALHGAGTRLGIVHRAALSDEVRRDLVAVSGELRRLMDKPPADAADSWTALRRLTCQAATAMGRENQTWHGLVRREHDDLPA